MRRLAVVYCRPGEEADNVTIVDPRIAFDITSNFLNGVFLLCGYEEINDRSVALPMDWVVSMKSQVDL